MTSALTAMTSFGVEAYFMARNFAKILQTPGYVTKISADVNKFEFGAELGLIWIYKTELGLFSGECTLLHALTLGELVEKAPESDQDGRRGSSVGRPTSGRSTGCRGTSLNQVLQLNSHKSQKIWGTCFLLFMRKEQEFYWPFVEPALSTHPVNRTRGFYVLFFPSTFLLTDKSRFWLCI